MALEITGQFPFAAWTSWTIYTDLQAGVQPFSVVKDAAITPDEGSVNPFVVGKPVLAPKRDYRLLVLPKGTDTTTIDESLRDVPASNILSRPTTGGSISWPTGSTTAPLADRHARRAIARRGGGHAPRRPAGLLGPAGGR